MNASQEEEFKAVTEFIIVGFPCNPEIRIFLFLIFLFIYFLTLTANITIIGLVWMDRHLHTPMYFLLANFSFLEIVYVSAIVPKLLNIFLTNNNRISFQACITQMYFFTLAGVTEQLYLVVMAYDRYLAICCPFHYAASMNLRTCLFLVLVCWLVSGVCCIFPLALVASLPFCGPNIVDHFICESTPLLNLACSDITFVKTIISIFASTVILSCFLFTIVSYTSIIITIIRMTSNSGKQKAFSTCSSHLTVVLIFFVMVCVMYVRPSEKDPLRNKVTAMLYGIVIPCLNPFIYSLKNKDMKKALMAVWSSSCKPRHVSMLKCPSMKESNAADQMLESSAACAKSLSHRHSN